MTYETILVDELEPTIWRVTINRPAVLNALAPKVMQELNAAFSVLTRDKSARCVLVTGAGEKSFVAGADISAMVKMAPLELRAMAQHALSTLRMIEELHCPVIALINGFALGGGCELAMACDWMIAADSARFGQPEVNLGICPGYGGTQRLPRLVGKAMALEMVTTGRMLNAEEALRVGLVNRVVPAATLLEEGLKQARLIASKGPIAVAISKHLVHTGADMALDKALHLEVDNFGLLCTTADRLEGMNAFVEKRPAKFVGA